jgi:guanine deaminase
MHAIRGKLFTFIDTEQWISTPEQHYQLWDDGLMVIDDQGLIMDIGDYDQLINRYENITIADYSGCFIMPGFIDCHVHFPQIDMIASYGEQLLTWLENYTFIEEQKFSDIAHATEVASFFLDQLLLNGTTTACVFGTVHEQSVEAFFSEAKKRRLRMICGKVLMDRNCPSALQDTAETGYHASKRLIEKWHNNDRLLYAVTPRFAPTSSRAQLDKAGQLLSEYSGLYLHTHLSENKAEVKWVNTLFPEADGYLSVYEQSQLVTKRSVFAHGIHLTDKEFDCLHQHESAIAFCPTSNLFLGSGCFNLAAADQHQVAVGLGTDVGAGTSLSMFHTLNEAYKTQQLAGNPLNPFKAFYLATLGAAKALDLNTCLGSLSQGKEADFIVIDPNNSALLKRRIANCQNLQEQLFVLSMLADDRHIAATYILGQRWQLSQC